MIEKKTLSSREAYSNGVIDTAAKFGLFKDRAHAAVQTTGVEQQTVSIQAIIEQTDQENQTMTLEQKDQDNQYELPRSRACSA